MSKPEKIPDLLIEKLALGELDPRAVDEVHGRIERDVVAAERLRKIQASDQEILDAYPARTMAAAIERRRRDEKRSRAYRTMMWTAVPVAAAIAAVIFIWPSWVRRLPAEYPASIPAQNAESTTVKGDPRLLVYRKSPVGIEELRRGARARPGDVLQIGYLAAHAKYGVILSVDGRGSVTLHFPKDASEPTALEEGGARTLPFAYELDDAPRFERFFLITADSPIDVGEVLDAARSIGADDVAALPLSPGLRQTDILVRKTGERTR